MSYEDYGHIDNMDMDVIDSYGGFKDKIKQTFSSPNVIATIMVVIVIMIMGVAFVGPIAGIVREDTTAPVSNPLKMNLTISESEVIPFNQFLNLLGNFSNPNYLNDSNYDTFINVSEDNGYFNYNKYFKFLFFIFDSDQYF